MYYEVAPLGNCAKSGRKEKENDCEECKIMPPIMIGDGIRRNTRHIHRKHSLSGKGEAETAAYTWNGTIARTHVVPAETFVRGR